MRRAFTAFVASASMLIVACGRSGEPESGESGTQSAPAQTATAATAEPPSSPDAPVSNAPAAPAAATPAVAGSRAVDSNPPGDECGASRVAQFVAQKATPAVRARLAAEVGHDRIRWVGPDTAVTMDFRPDRLNVKLDADDVITGGNCS